VQPLLLWKSNKYYIFWEQIYSLMYAVCNNHAPYCHLWTVWLYGVFPHYLINGMIFEKRILNIKHLFWFSLQLLYKIFFIREIPERDMMKIYIGLHVKYPFLLSDFNKTWFASTDFRNIFKHKILWKSVQWEPSCSMWTDGRRDITKLIVAFCNFAKAP
jgi:hypothetical protein